MKKYKNGFTLVELLAVIAILSILTILSLPSIMKVYNESKKNTFVSEVQTVAKNSSMKYIDEKAFGKRISEISSDGQYKLDLDGEELNYYVKLNSKGEITYLEVSNDSFCIQTNKSYKDITSDDIKDGSCDERLSAEDLQVTEIRNMASTSSILDKTKFRNYVASNSPTEIYFVITGKDSGSDISNNSGEPIYAWMDGNKMYVSAKDANKRIKLPADSLGFFSSGEGHSEFCFISKIDVTYIDTAYVKNMKDMFDNTGSGLLDSFEIIGLDYWDTNSVETMEAMFYYMAPWVRENWNIGNLSKWDTSNVTNMSRMFGYCAVNTKKVPENFNVNNWDTSNVTNMSEMFLLFGHNAENDFNLNLNNWDTSKVTDMYGMFHDVGTSTTNSFNLDISSFDTSNVTDMSNMFYNTGSNATSWDVKIKNNGRNTTTKLYGKGTNSTSPSSGKTFTLK